MLSRFITYLQGLLLCVALGGMWVLAYVAVPIIFQQLPDKVLAGRLAGEVLVYSNYLVLLCFILLVLLGLFDNLKSNGMGNSCKLYLVLIASSIVLILLNQFFVFPTMQGLKELVAPFDVMSSPLRGEFIFWHGVSSVIYLTHSLLGVGVLITAYPNSKPVA